MAGGGSGEAMLLGAAMGGGSAALTGGDPLKGALLGGLTGGVGGGISTGLSALVPEVATTALTTAGEAVASGAGGASGATTSAIAPNVANATSLAPLSQAGGSLGGFNPAAAQSAMQGSTNFALNAPSIAPGSPYALGAPSIAPGGGGIVNLSAAAPPAPGGGTFTEGMAKFAKDPLASIKANPFTAGASALAGATGAREEFERPEEYRMRGLRFSDDYRAAYAEGGIASLASGGYDRVVGEQPMYSSNMARGGISDLGGYSDYARGGRMLRGPGDGMSDSIPASIEGKRPARLANEEFVVPADVVSHLGNGSSDAGAKQLYAMMDKVRTARTGRKSQGREINPSKYMPAYA